MLPVLPCLGWPDSFQPSPLWSGQKWFSSRGGPSDWPGLWRCCAPHPRCHLKGDGNYNYNQTRPSPTSVSSSLVGHLEYRGWLRWDSACRLCSFWRWFLLCLMPCQPLPSKTERHIQFLHLWKAHFILNQDNKICKPYIQINLTWTLA